MKAKTTKNVSTKSTVATKITAPVKASAPAKAPAKAKATIKAPAAAKVAIKAPAAAKVAVKTPAATKASATVKVVKTASKKQVTFTYRAEKGCTVFLAGNFNKWSDTAKEMTDLKNTGVYTASITLEPGTYEYKYVINGTWCADPECADWVQNDHGTLNSVKHVSA